MPKVSRVGVPAEVVILAGLPFLSRHSVTVEPDSVNVLASLASSHKERPDVTGVAPAGERPEYIATTKVIREKIFLIVFVGCKCFIGFMDIGDAYCRFVALGVLGDEMLTGLVNFNGLGKSYNAFFVENSYAICFAQNLRVVEVKKT